MLSSNKSDAVSEYLISQSTNRLGVFNRQYPVALQFQSGLNQTDGMKLIQILIFKPVCI